MDRMILITTTSDNRAELDEIATFLVAQRLAACCQIGGPITSWYRWQDQTESTNEWVCSIKTMARKFPGVRDAILRMHHYDVPQIIAIGVSDASEDYHGWVEQSVDSD